MANRLSLRLLTLELYTTCQNYDLKKKKRGRIRPQEKISDGLTQWNARKITEMMENVKD